MLSWAFVNLKPGVGKTTSAVFLAHALHERGLRPLLVDCDPAASALRWSDLAGGFPFGVLPAAIAGVNRELRHHTAGIDAVVFDAPQLEDHARITRGAMLAAGCWIAPLAPAGIEVDRMASVADEWADVQALRSAPADEVVLLNRTNRPEPTRTGPDAEVRETLTRRGYHVLDTQIVYHDLVYRQAFGCPVDVADTAYLALVTELMDRADQRTQAVESGDPR